ncbi:hypothetical protein FHS19_006983 [Paenibacillus rhizosphaerae]|uniref:Uncharacterized protein n=1 Tax=Paenibacillus rhizosphaerae TaxID=297318 RepID=A0A839TYA9_9BACL|nr:hypothetical protein [Paenibacillus rhizosphaerae]
MNKQTFEEAAGAVRQLHYANGQFSTTSLLRRLENELISSENLLDTIIFRKNSIEKRGLFT